MMKRFILVFLFAASLISSKKLSAQTFTVAHDTVYATIGSLNTVEDAITNTTSGSITINWDIIATNFPSDWLAALGICDNNICYSYSSTPGLWNGTSGSTQTSYPYAVGVGDFHAQMDLTSATETGPYYVTVSLSAQGFLGSNKTETFIITKAPLGVSNVTNADNNITLYPNPARNDINIVYGETAGVKNIAIYNIIGKVLTFYKVAGNSANLDISNIPSGIYFLRLLDARGNTIATRKFTRQ